MASTDVALISDWVKKNKHLPQDFDDYFIECFIKTAKGSVQKAKQILENFWMIRHLHEFKYHMPWDPFSDELVNVVNRYAMVKLPTKTPEGYNIILCYPNKGEPDPNFNVKMTVLTNFFITTLLWEHNMGDCESIVIVDHRNVTLQDIKGLTPTLVSDIAKFVKGAIPQRMKAVYDINVPPILAWTFNFMKPFLSEKMNSRRFAYSNGDDLFKHVDKELLTSEYGGPLPSVFEIYEATTKKHFLKYRERFVAQKELVLAEKPFVPAHLNNTDYDTFRKLDID